MEAGFGFNPNEHREQKNTAPDYRRAQVRPSPELQQADALPQNSSESVSLDDLYTQLPNHLAERYPSQTPYDGFGGDTPTIRPIQQDVFAHPEDKGVFTMIRDKIVNTRIGKALALLGVLSVGTGGKFGVDSYHESSNRLEQKEAIGNEAQEIALQSRYDKAREILQAYPGLPQETDTITLPNNNTMTRGELRHLINEQFTQKMINRHNGSYDGHGGTLERCESEDGTLDMQRCFDEYGYQAVSDKTSLDTLSLMSGYSLEELNMHNKMMREALTFKTTFDPGTEKERTENGLFFDSSMLAKAEHYHKYAEDQRAFTADLISVVIRDLDLTHATPDTQHKAEFALKTLMQGESSFTADITKAANGIAHIEESINQSQFTKDSSGIMPELDVYSFKAKLGGDALNELSPNENGALHNVIEQLNQARDNQLEAIKTQLQHQLENLEGQLPSDTVAAIKESTQA